MKQILNNKYFLLVIIALTWGSSFILIKKTLPVFDPFQIGAFRAGFSGLLLSFIGIPALRRMSRKDIFWIALSGIINALDPIFTLILGVLLFGIRSKPIQYLGAIIGFGGAFILVYASDSENSQSHYLYTLLLIIGSALYAISALIVEIKLKHIKSTELTSSIYVFWMVPALIILAFSGFFTEIDFSQTETLESLGYLLFLTLVTTTLVMFLFFKLVQDTSAVFVSTISLLLPVIAVFWGILDGEKFTFWYALGGILVLIGVNFIREETKEKEPREIE